jgi:hypothetical protein
MALAIERDLALTRELLSDLQEIKKLKQVRAITYLNTADMK